MKFVGWVPTVTGHLSFSTIGSTTFPQKCHSAFIEDRSVFLQQRDLLDIIVPLVDGSKVGEFFQELVANHVIGQSGIFSFAALGEAVKSSEQLSGRVFLIPRKLAKDELKEIKSIVASSTPQDMLSEEEWQKVESLCEISKVVEAQFELDRGGRLAIEIAGDHEKGVKRIVANQFFYFFKDICHVHQHHDPKLDAITEVYEVNDDEDETWIAHTQSALYRAIIRYKRFRKERSLFRASGILAYANSFKDCYASDQHDQRQFNEAQLNQSLAVAREEIQHFDQKRTAQIEAFRGFFFALFGAIISGALLSRLALPPGEFVDIHRSIPWVTQKVAQNPYETVSIVVFMAFAYQFLTHGKDPADIRLLRNLLSLLQGYRLRWHVLTNIVLTAMFCCLAYYLLFVLSFSP